MCSSSFSCLKWLPGEWALVLTTAEKSRSEQMQVAESKSDISEWTVSALTIKQERGGESWGMSVKHI